jgi:trigger factor
VDTRVERVDDTTVKLAVTVEPDRVKRALDQAARHLAEEVRIPGFRKGRVPRKVLEARLGKDAVLQHAVQDSLPEFYAEAIRTEELEPVGQPEFDLDTFEEGSDAEFTATVEVRPEFDPPPVEGVLVPHPEWQVTDDEIEQELDRLRERFAEAETVDRPIQVGDLAVVTISATHNGQPVDEASVDDQLYQVEDPDESGQTLDRELLGTSTGGIVKFSETAGDGRELDVTVIVKDVKTLRLPDADDEFAITASEFDTIDELRDSIADQLRQAKLDLARSALRGRVVETVSELVEVPLPKSMVEQEVQFQLARFAREAERQEVPFDQFLQAAGTTADELQEQLRENARQTVRAQLVVDRIGREAGVSVTNDDLMQQISAEAQRLNMPVQELATFMSDPDRIGVLFTDAFRRKTIDHILERVEITGGPDTDEADADADAQAGADDADTGPEAVDTGVDVDEVDADEVDVDADTGPAAVDVGEDSDVHPADGSSGDDTSAADTPMEGASGDDTPAATRVD